MKGLRCCCVAVTFLAVAQLSFSAPFNKQTSSVISLACDSGNTALCDKLTANANACPFPFPVDSTLEDLWPCVHPSCLGDVSSTGCVAQIQLFCEATNWAASACSSAQVPCDGLFPSAADNSGPCFDNACISGTPTECSTVINSFCSADPNRPRTDPGCAPSWAVSNLAEDTGISGGSCPFPYPSGSEELIEKWPCNNPNCETELSSRGCVVAIYDYCQSLPETVVDSACAGEFRVDCIFQRPSYPDPSEAAVPESPCEAAVCVGDSSDLIACKIVVDEYCLFYGSSDEACEILVPFNGTGCDFGQPSQSSELSTWPCVSEACVDSAGGLATPHCRRIVTSFCDSNPTDKGCRAVQTTCPFSGSNSPCEKDSCLQGDVLECKNEVDSYCEANNIPACQIDNSTDSFASCAFWPMDTFMGSVGWPCEIESCLNENWDDKTCKTAVIDYCSVTSTNPDRARWRDYPPCSGVDANPIVAPCPFGPNAYLREGICNTEVDGNNRYCDPTHALFDNEICSNSINEYCDNPINEDDKGCGCPDGMLVSLSVSRGEASFSDFSNSDVKFSVWRDFDPPASAPDAEPTIEEEIASFLMGSGFSEAAELTLSSTQYATKPSVIEWTSQQQHNNNNPKLCLVRGVQYHLNVSWSLVNQNARLRFWVNRDDTGARMVLRDANSYVGSGAAWATADGTTHSPFTLQTLIDPYLLLGEVEEPQPLVNTIADPSASPSPSPPYTGSECLGTSAPCMNGGFCVPLQVSFNCACQQNDDGPLFEGQLCERRAGCNPNPCKNSGTCSLSSELTGGFTCNCPTGYSGQDCSVLEDACLLANPCRSRDSTARCISTCDSATCSCSDGYSGQFCEERLLARLRGSIRLGIAPSSFGVAQETALTAELAILLSVSASNISDVTATKQDSTTISFVITTTTTTGAENSVRRLSTESETLQTRLQSNSAFPSDISLVVLSVVQDTEDCNGAVNGGATLDQCGVCSGTNDCLDCAGVPNGQASLDSCDQCNGDNSACSDCFGVPHGTAVVDGCGVCNGDNSTCAVNGTNGDDDDDSGGSGGGGGGGGSGAMIGGIVGGVVAMGLIGAAGAYFWQKKAQKTSNDDNSLGKEQELAHAKTIDGGETPQPSGDD